MRIKRWHVLDNLVKRRRAKSGVELGVYTGATFLHLLENNPDLEMVGVDLWKAGDGVAYDQVDLDLARMGVVSKVSGEFSNRARILEMDTSAAAYEFEDEEFDFVFIDGDHRTDGVLRDIRSWAPKVQRNGFIAGHDIDWDSVKDAVEMCCDQYQKLSDDVWIAERRDVFVFA